VTVFVSETRDNTYIESEMVLVQKLNNGEIVMKKEIKLNVCNTRNIKKIVINKFYGIFRNMEEEHFKSNCVNGMLIRRGSPYEPKKRFEQCVDSYIEKLNNGDLEKLIFDDFHQKNEHLITEE
jgi:hypothetical protein